MTELEQLRADWLQAEADLTAADEAGVSDEEFAKALAKANRTNTEYAAAYQKNHGAEQ